MSQRAGLTRAASDSRFSRSRDLPSSQSTDPKCHGATPHVSGWRRTQTQAWGVPELPLRPPPPARGSTRGSHGTYVVVVLYGLPREVQHSPWDYPLTEEVSNLEVGG